MEKEKEKEKIPKPRWKYHSENFSGNIHTTVATINKYYPEWDITHMESSGFNTIVVWREPLLEEKTNG